MMYGEEDDAEDNMYGDEYGGEGDYGMDFGGDFNEIDAYGMELDDENIDPDSLA